MGHSSRPIQSGAAASKSMKKRQSESSPGGGQSLQGNNRGPEPTKEWGIDAFSSRLRWVLRVSSNQGMLEPRGLERLGKQGS